MIQLLDRHERACEAFAERLAVPLQVAPVSLPETPFVVLPVLRRRFWAEVALWWPERRVLVCADALGTVPYFRAGREPAGVHPFLRPRPPRALRGLGAEHLLVGHGEGLHGPETAAAVEDALRTGAAADSAVGRRESRGSCGSAKRRARATGISHATRQVRPKRARAGAARGPYPPPTPHPLWVG